MTRRSRNRTSTTGIRDVVTRWSGAISDSAAGPKGAAVVALTVALLGAYYVSQATTTKAPAW